LENLIGDEGSGFKYALTSLDNERAFSAAMCVGIGKRALDESVKYGKEREQFGQPIVNFQQVQYMLAEMATKIYAAECMMHDIIARTTAGERLTQYAAMVKLYCGRMLTEVCLDAIQIHGGYGYIRDYPVERLLRDAKLIELGGGTNEIQRLVIARHLLRESGESVSREKTAEKAPAEQSNAECIDIIRRMPEGFRPEKAHGLDATLQLDIQGAGKWLCRIKEGKCEVVQGEDGTATAVIVTDARTWVGLSTGKIEPMGVFMSGALKVKGDVSAVMKVMGSFKPLK
jgi:putative sterol carrier protein